MSKVTLCPNCNSEVQIEDSQIDKPKTLCSNCKNEFKNPFGKDDSLNKQTTNVIIAFSVIAILGFGYNYIQSNKEPEINNDPGVQIVTSPDKYTKNPISAINIFNQTSSYQEIGNRKINIIHCTITNVSDKLVQSVLLKGVFYDENGNVVGTGTGVGLNIAAGGIKTIDIHGVDIVNPYKFQVEIEDVIL